MKIVQVPHPVLQVKVHSVNKIDKKIKTIVRTMIATLEKEVDPEGVGLAANQVGLSLAIFVMKPTKKAPVTVCINPKITFREKLPIAPKVKRAHKKPTHARLEGCLSIPRLWGYVARSPRVGLEFLDLEGKTHRRTFSGFEAVIVQHEVDHLEGVVFTQRVLEQKRKLYKEVEGELESYTL